MSHVYPDIQQARRGVLLESCQALNSSGAEYAVAGGWAAYLRAEGHHLTHPGTKDVDLLFNDDREPIKIAVRQLMAAGYLPSAKHPFQLLKELNVGDQSFVFNIDLMHPLEAEAKRFEDMFEDIVDLGIREDYRAPDTHHVKSICFPSAKIIFDENLWSPVQIEATLPSGLAGSTSVPLMDECGLVLSKCESASGKKRDRDAFDIYFALSAPQGEATARKVRSLADRFEQVATHLGKLRNFVTKEGRTFEQRVGAYCKEGEGSAERVRRLLFDG